MQNEEQLRLNWVEWIVLAVVIVGAINWGLVGAAYFLTDGGNWNVVNLVFGADGLDVPVLENLVYLIVGLGGLYEVYMAYQFYTRGRRTATGTETV
ncbi:MAG: uncharacterized membrane protein YuzA (DUF378 family) [Halobacteriales archaeon]|jgi:uncharacterized membrane protein YuzA (DUF378 family)